MPVQVYATSLEVFSSVGRFWAGARRSPELRSSTVLHRYEQGIPSPPSTTSLSVGRGILNLSLASPFFEPLFF